MAERFAQKLQLEQIKIKPIHLENYTGATGSVISTITRFSLDVGGNYQRTVYAYVVPKLGDGTDLILGIPWMADQKAVVEAEGPRLRFADGFTVESVENEPKLVVKQISAQGFAVRNRQRRRDKTIRIFAASIKDIEKALRVKKYTDPATKLPAHYHDFLDVFDRKKADELPPHRPGVDHRIELVKDDKGKPMEPPWGPLYSMSRGELLVLRKMLTELLEKGFIRVSSSAAAAPVLFAHKPGGGLRFCVDYRALNAITKKDRYPLPLINETLERISRAKWFTKLDVIAAFHKIRIAPGDEWLTAFRTRFGLFEWLVTPFGMANAPSTFQRYINWTLRDFLDEFASAYIDDVLIFTDGSLTKHRQHVRQVLERLKNAGLQLDIDKCEFEVKSTKYLGFIVEAGKGVRMDPDKVKAILEWQAPTSARGIRSFLGFANFYRRFIQNFSDIVRPLTALTHKGALFAWGEEQTKAFELLKKMFTTAPILAQFDPDRKTVVETDASNWATGATMSQYDDDGVLRPVAYISKKNTPAECNYEIHDKELLAIINALKEWESELISLPRFELITDHRNLEYFKTVRRLNERQMRWSHWLSRFNYEMHYRPGKLAARPDALSRREQDMPQDADDDRLKARDRCLVPLRIIASRMRVQVSRVHKVMSNLDARSADECSNQCCNQPRCVTSRTTRAEESLLPLEEHWKEAAQSDASLKEMQKAVKEGDTRFPSKLRVRVSIAECSMSPDGHLLYRGRKWVPNSEPLRTRILQETHDSVFTGHPGKNTLYTMIARNFYWSEMSADVRRFVQNCDKCGANRVWRERRQGLLKPLPIPDRKWREIAIDFITKLPTSDGCEDIMVIGDRLGKGVILVPCERTDSETVAQLLIDRFIGYHGVPSAITSDRGPQFVSQFWEHFCKRLHIQRRLSTAFHPQTDGQIERMNATLEAYLRNFCNYAQTDWKSLLPMAQLAINGRDAASTGVSPFFLDHGYNVEPLEIEGLDREAAAASAARSPKQRAEAIIAKMKEAVDMAQSELAAAQQRQEEYSNRSRSASPRYAVESKVWLDLRNVRTDRPSRKLDAQHAKFTVLEAIGSHAYRLDTPPGVHNVFHVSLLRPAASNPFPSQSNGDYQPPPVLIDGEAEYVVEEILQEREKRVGRGRRTEYLVKWVGYERPTWEPAANLADTAALDAWEARQPRFEGGVV
jgi:transposase InsO family protein